MLPKFSVIIAVSLVTLHMAGQPNKRADRENAHPQNKSPIAAASNKEQNTKRTTKSTNCNPPQRNTSPERPEWWLVGVGIATIFVIGWQAIETRRATGVAQESIGIAATENRPWVLLEFGEYGSRIEQPTQMQEGRPASCQFYVANYGRTPAKLLLIKADMVISTSPKQSPATEIIEDGKRFNPQIIPPGETLPQIAELPLSSANDFGEAALGGYRDVEKYLWLRVAVGYGHTSNIAVGHFYRTEACYLWIKLGGYWRLTSSKIT